MFEYDIRNPLVHVPLSLTDTCQLFLSITESVVRENRMLRSMRRGLETGPR